MKKFVSYFIVFILGFVVCAWVIYHFYGSPKDFQGIASVNSPRPALSLASGSSNQVRKAAEIVSSYVVNIDTVGRPVLGFGREGFPDFFGFPFLRPEEVTPRGQASGVIFTPNGYIITNNHVVKDAAQLTVTLENGKRYPAKLIGTDPTTDLAVIKINANGLKYATFGDSSTLGVGDWVIAVGNALGFKSTVTVGVVSAIRHRGDVDQALPAEELIQTDAAINRGNSGGALADLNGNLVGINTAIVTASPDGGNIGIGFAIPSNTAKRIADQLVKRGKVVRPWLGIGYMGLNDETRAELKRRGVTNLPRQDGAIIIEVYSGSPAAEAGLQPQDVILKFNGKPVSGHIKPERGKVSIADEILKLKVGDRALLEVWHAADGHISTVGVRVAERPVNLSQ
jgi:S1-C subfamily serine protease